jgi:intergrase/recombinase
VNIEESAALAVESVLPVKSKEKYENAYRQFDDWCKEKRVKEINEEALLAYFQQKSKVYKSSTLWSIYSLDAENNIIREEKYRYKIVFPISLNFSGFCSLKIVSKDDN